MVLREGERPGGFPRFLPLKEIESFRGRHLRVRLLKKKKEAEICNILYGVRTALYLFCLNLFYFMFMVVLLECVCICVSHVYLVSLQTTHQVADDQGLDSQTIMNHQVGARTRPSPLGRHPVLLIDGLSLQHYV